MTQRVLSLRSRLLIVTLVPLFCISAGLGVWRITETNRLAENLFDRTLLAAALSIARDFGIREGEALSSDTLVLLDETSGGRIFYHVKGPDGSFVTGYATPPINPGGNTSKPEAPTFDKADVFSGRYRGAPVRVVQLVEPVDLGWVQGNFVISVWQDLSARDGFAWQIVRQTMIALGLLLLAVLGVTWFGLRLALRPLTDLQDAIAQRQPHELSPIKRRVPFEVAGIVATFNQLVDRISRRISSKDQFVSNAAHQLRTPIAGVLSLAQTLETETEDHPAQRHATELATAAQHLSRLSNQLLSFERNREVGDLAAGAARHDLNVLATEVVERSAPALLREGYDIGFERCAPVFIRCEPLLVQEVLQNLIDNAVKHGGRADLSIKISVVRQGSTCALRVVDNGVGLDPSQSLSAFARFSQVRPGTGSGLGLSIAQLICRNHGGSLAIEDSAVGTSIAAFFPVAP